MSDFVEWADDLIVGVKEMNAQHEKLIELVNEMHKAIKERRASEVTTGIFYELIVYAQTHFRTEEVLMNRLNYHGYAAHKASHDEFIEQVVDLKERFNSRKASINFELMHFLKQYLAKHIIGEDSKMGAYLMSVKKVPGRRRFLFGRPRADLQFR